MTKAMSVGEIIKVRRRDVKLVIYKLHSIPVTMKPIGKNYFFNFKSHTDHQYHPSVVII